MSPDVVPAIEQRKVTDLVLTRLRTLTDVTVGDGEVPDPLPVIQGTTRVAPYAIWYPGVRHRSLEVDVANSRDDLVYTGQCILAAGFRADAEYLLDRVTALFFRWAPVIDGVAFGPFQPPTGYTAGLIARDDRIQPPRYRAVLQYQTTATT